MSCRSVSLERSRIIRNPCLIPAAACPCGADQFAAFPRPGRLQAAIGKDSIRRRGGGPAACLSATERSTRFPEPSRHHLLCSALSSEHQCHWIHQRVGICAERGDVEFLASYPRGIIGVQGLQGCRIDVADILAFEDRPVPGFVAGQALVDKPGVKFFAVSVEPDLAAGSERPETSTPTTGYPGLRGNSGSDGPLDPKNAAHAVLAFREEVHQDGGGINPLAER